MGGTFMTCYFHRTDSDRQTDGQSKELIIKMVGGWG
jgi:hypothetical protein